MGTSLRGGSDKGEEMATTMTLAEFYNYIRDSRKRISDVYREIEEIQYQFNDLHARLLSERQKLLSAYTPELLKGEGLTAEIQGLLAVQQEVERKSIEDEIARLSKEITDKRQSADALIKTAQQQLAHLRQQNPILNQQEEELKARRVSVQQQIQRLNEELKRAGCFPIGWIAHFSKRRRLRRERQKLTENLLAIEDGIRKVRAKWEAERKKVLDAQAALRDKWQALTVEASQLQAMVDDLSTNLQEYAERNAAQNWLGNLTEVPAAAGAWQERLTVLADLNRNKANYEKGLTSVAEILGLLKGLGEGMDRFIRSVATVYEEQKRYNLPMIKLTLSDAATSFHAVWPDFQAKVKDEKYLGAHPLEFSQHIQELVRTRFGEAAIQRMFEDFGNALSKATKQWR